MNRRDAKEILHREAITFGDLKKILERSSADEFRRSTVNPGFSLADTHGIFVAGIADYDNGKVIRPSNPRDMLMAVNIIRDFGVAPLFDKIEPEETA